MYIEHHYKLKIYKDTGKYTLHVSNILLKQFDTHYIWAYVLVSVRTRVRYVKSVEISFLQNV